MYGHNHKVKSAVNDRPPSLRRDTNSWHYDLDESKYLKAFELKRPYFELVTNALQSNEVAGEDLYVSMLVDRVKTLRNFMEHLEFPLLISAGAIEDKERLFNLLFAEQNIEFKELNLPNGKRYKKAVVHVNGRDLTILLTLFFSNHGALKYEGLEQLYQVEVSPLFTK